MRNHGTDPTTRFSLMRERVEAMKEIWTQDEASYHGDFVKFDQIWSWPKPVQSPHPPIYVGGMGTKTHDRVLAYGDAWMPMLVGSDEAVIASMGELQARGDVPVTLFAGSSKPDRLSRYAQAGFERVVLHVPQGNAAAVEARIDEIVARARQAGLM